MIKEDKTEHSFIQSLDFQYEELTKKPSFDLSLLPSKITFKDLERVQSKNFADYLYAGNEINFSVGFDFTNGNK